MKIEQPANTRLIKRTPLGWMREMGDQELLTASFDHPYDKDRLYELAFRAVWYGVEGVTGIAWEFLPQTDSSGVRYTLAVPTAVF